MARPKRAVENTVFETHRGHYFDCVKLRARLTLNACAINRGAASYPYVGKSKAHLTCKGCDNWKSLCESDLIMPEIVLRHVPVEVEPPVIFRRLRPAR